MTEEKKVSESFAFACGGPGEGETMRQWMAPIQVDQSIRAAIQFCWMALPKEKRNIEEVERQIRRLVDRALENLREDATAFGLKP